MPSVSVIMPMYNSARYVARALGSLAAQTFADYELIAVNDGSTDGTAEMVASFAAGDEVLRGRVRLLTHAANRGCAAARATGMQAATGDYIIHVDSDDWVEPDYLSSLHCAAVATDADVVICNMAKEWPDGKRQVLATPAGKTADEYLAMALSGEIYCSLWNKLIRRRLFVEHDIWPVDGLNMLDDKSVVVRVFYHAVSFAVVDKVLYHYDKGATGTVSSCSDKELLASADCYEALVSSFFASRPLSEACCRARNDYRLLCAGLRLKSMCSLQPGERTLLRDTSLRKIWSLTTLPFHYKILLSVYKPVVSL